MEKALFTDVRLLHLKCVSKRIAVVIFLISQFTHIYSSISCLVENILVTEQKQCLTFVSLLIDNELSVIKGFVQ